MVLGHNDRQHRLEIHNLDCLSKNIMYVTYQNDQSWHIVNFNTGFSSINLHLTQATASGRQKKLSLLIPVDACYHW